MQTPLATAIVVAYSFVFLSKPAESAIINGWSGKECGVLGIISGIICISDVQFKVPQDSESTYTCPAGTWCADSPSICINKDKPACTAMPKQVCGICTDNMSSTCINKNQFISCSNDSLNEPWKTSCPPTEPICTVDFDENGFLTAVCIQSEELATCFEDPIPLPEDPAPTPPDCPMTATCPPPTTCPPPKSTWSPPPQPDCDHHETRPGCERDIQISVTITYGN